MGGDRPTAEHEAPGPERSGQSAEMRVAGVWPLAGPEQALDLDPASRMLTCGDAGRRLTPGQACVMLHLLRVAPHPVSTETIWQALRGDVPAIKTSAVRTLICELRKACRELVGEDLIETVYGKGYRLPLDGRRLR